MRFRSVFSAGLVFGVAAVVLSGCGGEYAAEKRLWKAHQAMAKITKNPAGSPDGLYSETREMFEGVVGENPRSLRAAEALASLGQLYAFQKKHSEAEEAFRQIIGKFPDNQELSARALNSVARLREQEGRWPEALSIYRDIHTRFEKTAVALPLPLYIARSYARQKEMDQAKKAYGEAEVYYKSIEEKYPQSRLDLAVKELRFSCYVETGRWPEALAVLQAIRETYPRTPEALRAIRARIGILRGLKASRNGASPDLSVLDEVSGEDQKQLQ